LRLHLYSAGDIARLAGNKNRGRKAADIAAAILDWGLPALASGITLIEGDRLFFRGRDVARLAAHATLEETARLLWDCSEDSFGAAPPVARTAAPLIASLAEAFPLDRCMTVLPVAGIGTAMTWPRDQRRLWHDGAMLLRLVAAAATGTAPSDAPTHRHAARAWGRDDCAAQSIRAALVLCADHELNASAFAVRVAASTGASLAARAVSSRSCSRKRSASGTRRNW
jgi:citrate synthase